MEAHIKDGTKTKAKIQGAGSRKETRKMRETKRKKRKKGTYPDTCPLYAWHHEL